MIREKATEDLRHMTDEEGLILQGCGGDLQEWVDGINDLLPESVRPAIHRRLWRGSPAPVRFAVSPSK